MESYIYDEKKRLPQCLFCNNLSVDCKITSPTSNGHPCICGYCSVPNLYEDCYGYKTPNGIGVWIDLVKMTAWAEGSCDIPKNCIGFIKSKE
jgi:hypothetical protein